MAENGKSRVLKLTLPSELYEAVKKAAEKSKTNPTDYVRRLCFLGLQNEGNGKSREQESLGELKESLSVKPYIERLSESVRELNIHLKTSQLTRDEVLESLTAIAKYSPQIESQYRAFFDEIYRQQMAQGEAHKAVLLDLEKVRETVGNGKEEIARYVEAFKRLVNSFETLEKQASRMASDYQNIDQKADDFSRRLERKFVSRVEHIERFTYKIYGIGIVVFMACLLTLFVLQRVGVFVPDAAQKIEKVRGK